MDEVRRDADEKIITSTKNLIHEVTCFSDGIGGGETEGTTGPAEPGRAAPPARKPGAQDDGYAEIRIADDSMKVLGAFYPPLGTGRPLGMDAVASLLKLKNVKYGVLWENVTEAIQFCNKNKARKTDVLIALGKLPADEIPPHYVIDDFLTAKNEPETTTDDEDLDFKEKSPFKLVNRGQVLAKKVPGRPGELGYNVFGKSMAYKAVHIPEIMAGPNVRSDNEVYVAACDGRFQHQGSKFWVDELLFIDTDVGYKTGHIVFPGDILIKGTVQDGFKINGGKSIVCQNTLDASEVICKGDLIVQNGIIGKKEGIVRVGGGVIAKFIEKCSVEAEGRIDVKKNIVQANVSTLNKISLGDRGSIMGGVIFARLGVEARQIGNPSALRTEIVCGVDFHVHQKLEWVKKKNIELVFKQKEIQNRMSREKGPHPSLAAIERSLLEAIDKLNQTSRTLLFHLDTNEDSKIIVRGVVYPGTFIEICRVRYSVTSILPRVVFSLNKRSGKIEVRTF